MGGATGIDQRANDEPARDRACGWRGRGASAALNSPPGPFRAWDTMNELNKPQIADKISIVKGIPLCKEAGLGALTLPGFLREVTTRFADREALVLHTPAGAIRWTYAMLWEQAVDVARALLSCGVGKDTRVGVLMTNRPEWISAFFGIGLAGGVAVALSTFSTPLGTGIPVADFLRSGSCCLNAMSQERTSSKCSVHSSRQFEPRNPVELVSVKFPFLRRVAVVGERPERVRLKAGPTSSPGQGDVTFACRGDGHHRNSGRRRSSVSFVWLDQSPQGHPEFAPGGGHSMLAMAAHSWPRGRYPLLDGEWLHMVGQLWVTLSARLSRRAGPLCCSGFSIPSRRFDLCKRSA